MGEVIVGVFFFGWLVLLTKQIDNLRFRIESDRFNNREAIRRLTARVDAMEDRHVD